MLSAYGQATLKAIHTVARSTARTPSASRRSQFGRFPLYSIALTLTAMSDAGAPAVRRPWRAHTRQRTRRTWTALDRVQAPGSRPRRYVRRERIRRTDASNGVPRPVQGT